MEQKFTPIFHEKEMEFTMNYERNLYLIADSLRLEQIIFNLLDNSMKYSPSGGKVSLAVWEYKSEIHISIKITEKGYPKKTFPIFLIVFIELTNPELVLLEVQGWV